MERYSEALNHTRDQLFALRHLLRSLIGHGDVACDKVAQWTGYCADQTSETAPSITLGKDLLLVMACLDIVHRRIKLENERHIQEKCVRKCLPDLHQTFDQKGLEDVDINIDHLLPPVPSQDNILQVLEEPLLIPGQGAQHSTPTGLPAHQKRRLTCTSCGKSFSKKHTLKSHMGIHRKTSQ